MTREPGARPAGRGGPLRIAISGKSGCGNSTVSRIVAARLGLRVVNYTFKDLARDRGMSFEEVCRLAENDPQYDFTIDRMQVSLAGEGRCVLGSRLAIWLLRDSALTVYLEAGLEARAERISRREGIPLPEALEDTTRGTSGTTTGTSGCTAMTWTPTISPTSSSTPRPSTRSLSRTPS